MEIKLYSNHDLIATFIIPDTPVEALKNDPAKIQALATEMKNKSDALAAAITANTPAPEPVPEPTPEPQPTPPGVI